MAGSPPAACLVTLSADSCLQAVQAKRLQKKAGRLNRKTRASTHRQANADATESATAIVPKTHTWSVVCRFMAAFICGKNLHPDKMKFQINCC
jgi:hypothetical protein